MSKPRNRLTLTFGKRGLQKATATGTEARKLFEALTGRQIDESKPVDFIPAIPSSPASGDVPVIKPEKDIDP